MDEHSPLKSQLLKWDGYIRNKKTYYESLQNITEQQSWEDWIIFMLEAIEVTSYETIARIDAIRDAMEIYQTKMKENFARHSKELLEIIFEQPYCTTQMLVNRGIAKSRTALSYLQELCELNLLKNIKIGRNTFYMNPVLFDILRKPADQFIRK